VESALITHACGGDGGEPRRRLSDWGGEACLELRTKEKGRNGAQGWKRCTFKYWRINKKIHGLILGGETTASALRSKVTMCLKMRRKMMVFEHTVGKKMMAWMKQNGKINALKDMYDI